MKDLVAERPARRPASRPNSNLVSARITPWGARARRRTSRARSTRPRRAPSARGRRRARPRASKSIASSWPTSAFVRRREDRLGQLLGLAQPGRQRDPGDRAAGLVVLPARAGDVAADDALDRQHLRRRTTSARPSTSSGTPSMAEIRWLGTISAVCSNQNTDSPVRTSPLSGIGVGMHGVVGRDAVARDHQQRRRAVAALRAYISRTLPLAMRGRSARWSRGAMLPAARAQGAQAIASSRARISPAWRT